MRGDFDEDEVDEDGALLPDEEAEDWSSGLDDDDEDDDDVENRWG